MLVQPQQTKDDDNDLQTKPVHMNNPPTSTETAPNESTPITFNVLVVGQAGIGKTGLIKLLLETSHLSPATSLPQLALLAEFANFAATCPTNSPSSILAELPATPHRPEIVLKLIDTPGLLYHDSHELEAGLHLVLRQIADSFEASNRASASVRSRISVPANGMDIETACQAQERRDKQIHLCASDT
jgi:septin family protein